MPIQIGNAPVSWGIFEFEGMTANIPYTQFLDEVVAAGYNGLELGPYGYLPTDPNHLRAELVARNLQMLSAFVPVRLVDAATHEQGVAQALQVGELLAAVGAAYIVLADENGTVPQLVNYAGQRTGSALKPSQWDVFAAGVNRIAQAVHEALGLQVVFHHHCAGYVETAEEVAALMQRTDPALVGLCLDTGHWHYAGGSALDAIATYGTRIRYLHLKDCSPSIRQTVLAEQLDYFAACQQGVFCELGQGDVPFGDVLTQMTALGYDGWAIVEQDVMGDDPAAPLASAQRNRDYLRHLGY